MHLGLGWSLLPKSYILPSCLLVCMYLCRVETIEGDQERLSGIKELLMSALSTKTEREMLVQAV